jgi:Spy/CpxP family protein refolding chaperone
MKRFTLSVVMTGVLGLAAYSFSGAQSPAGRPDGPRLGGGPGGGRGEIALLRGANLTDEQKDAIKAIRDAEPPAVNGSAAEPRLRRELDAELFADAPDTQKIATLQQQLAETHSARLARQVVVQQKIAQVLTAEQRAKIRERLTQPLPDRRRPGAGNGRRGHE